MPPDLADLDALDARDRMIRGELRAVELCEACLERIARREPEIGAFAYLDPDYPRAQARSCDEDRAAGRSPGPLHGLPVGLKDIVDTRDMPTENGTPLDAGRRPAHDAVIVGRLRAAGAVIMGKTVSTELGSMHPRGTRNPANSRHTPGGSSSGSAAAVAAGMVPLAIGTQTNGSVIRPASFCGVVGFKPSFGLIPRTGILPQASPLDTVGVFARSVAGAALLADALIGFDASDSDTRPSPPPRLLEGALSEPPVRPGLAFVKSPAWPAADAGTGEAFAGLVKALGGVCREVALPEIFAEGAATVTTLTAVGIARNYHRYYERGRGALSPVMQAKIEEGNTIAAVDYLKAIDRQRALAAGLDQVFERYDTIVTPAAPGEAPASLETTGNPAFNSLWTLCGVPAVTLPLLRGPAGMPIGVQLVGRRGEDARLLRTARWFARLMEGELSA